MDIAKREHGSSCFAMLSVTIGQRGEDLLLCCSGLIISENNGVDEGHL